MEHRDDDDDNDDVSFAKWMSSFWGHSWRDKDERGLRDHQQLQEASYRKASLPCPFPAFPSITSSDCHPRRHSHEDQGSRSHLPTRHHRKCSVDGSLREPTESQRRAHSKMQEFSESFERHLCLQTKPSHSVGPKGKKERDERHCLETTMRSYKRVEDRRSSVKDGDGPMDPLIERGPE
ncbi:leukemia NUP98 fusion partner 1 isoform X1 [Mus musculus]|uniref:Leukemia NUP98 fusion partner 1 n=1 Tax=Mus musculus TaxID=10090 RepID=A0A1B0GSK3_MOUSE|nr:leukemia NUP98 fusion partner 1 [Mus musculus]XP_030104759.1 leukemia NUP98 fusion partner 1 isoform X1 [Mus musculus]|eukprot:XP_006522891.1 PREDICTED: leukemia NUP98 fusion partner 1 [Mus musculus]